MGKVKTAHNPPNTVDNTTNLFGSGRPEPKKKQTKKRKNTTKSNSEQKPVAKSAATVTPGKPQFQKISRKEMENENKKVRERIDAESRQKVESKTESQPKSSATVTPGDRKEEPKKSKKQIYREERKSGNLSEESKKYAESRQKQAKEKRREREIGKVFGKKQVTYRIKDDKTGYKTVTRVGKEDKYVDSTGKEYKKFDKNKRVVEADTQYVHSKSGKGKERVEAKSKDKKRKYKAQLRHLQRSPVGRHGGKIVAVGGLAYGAKKLKDKAERQSENEPYYDRPLKEKAKRYAEDWVRRHTR